MLFHNRQSKFLVKPHVSLNKLNLEHRAEMKFLGTHIKMELPYTWCGRKLIRLIFF